MLDTSAIRSRFPAVNEESVLVDAPGGTQVPVTVIAAMADYFRSGVSNLGGPFPTSQATEAAVDTARRAIADMWNADPSGVVFGQNMTSLTFAISRALAKTWQPGDEVVVTSLDHDANIRPWVRAAEDAGVTVRTVEFDADEGTLDVSAFGPALTDRTRLVAFTAASNAIGTITDVGAIVQVCHGVGALTYVDAVHYAPHRAIDAKSWDSDFVVASAYKFFGPHTGILYGRPTLLESLDAYKVAPAPSRGPGKWETGTQSFESLSGVTAAVDYLASLGTGDDRATQVRSAFGEIEAHERALAERFVMRLGEVDGARIVGITDPVLFSMRTSTFAVDVEGRSSSDVAARLGERGIASSAGHYYAVDAMRRLTGDPAGGLTRVGFVHYHTMSDVDRVVDALEAIAVS